MTEKQSVDNTISLNIKFNITQFSKDVFASIPEASLSLQCLMFNYDLMEFTFFDNEDDKEYFLDQKKIEVGVQRFLERCLDGKWKNPMLNDPLQLLDVINWDADIVDMAIQTCVFDEIIYC